MLEKQNKNTANKHGVGRSRVNLQLVMNVQYSLQKVLTRRQRAETRREAVTLAVSLLTVRGACTKVAAVLSQGGSMITTRNLFSAGRLIQRWGVEGLAAASVIVGRDVALAMLVQQMIVQPGTIGNDQTDQRLRSIRRHLEKDGWLNWIEFIPESGHGVVFDVTERKLTHVVRVDRMEVPEAIGQTHIGMWMGGGSKLYCIPAGPPPHHEAFLVMRRLFRQLEAKLLAEAKTRIAERTST